MREVSEWLKRWQSRCNTSDGLGRYSQDSTLKTVSCWSRVAFCHPERLSWFCAKNNILLIFYFYYNYNCSCELPASHSAHPNSFTAHPAATRGHCDVSPHCLNQLNQECTVKQHNVEETFPRFPLTFVFHFIVHVSHSILSFAPTGFNVVSV